jgi:NAD(P)H-hydrate epimerase
MMAPDMLFSPLAAPEDIARWDRRAAAEYSLPTLLLMENAAREALRALEMAWAQNGGWNGLEALVLAGGGNNGGDGIALSRHLLNRGCRVRLFTLPAPGRYRGISRSHLNMARLAGVRAQKLHLPMRTAEAANIDDLVRGLVRQLEREGRPRLVVDALLGAGFRAPLRAEALAAVRALNLLRDRGAFVFALDIPSGLDALSGRPAPEAVRADATVTFTAAKPGLCLPWAAEYTGQLRTREIGLPAKLLREDPAAFRLINPGPGVLPAPDQRMHKGQKGRVLIVGGSAGLTGAPGLAALAAARAGAGLVTVAAPAGLCADIKHGRPEIMTLPLGAPADREWRPAHLEALLPHVAELAKGGRAALALGPGLGRSAFTANLVRGLLGLPERPPLVLDADGLFHFRLEAAPDALPLSLLRAGDALTPHPGEMLRLLNCSEGRAAEYPGRLLELPERLRALRRFCAACPATLLLKGAGTLVAQGQAPAALAPFAEPNLAVGGSGDVLSGLIAALLARDFNGDRLTSLVAACLGAHAHGRAGRLTRRKFPAGGNLASDLAEMLPLALAELYPS